jgi:hypothetical protein
MPHEGTLLPPPPSAYDDDDLDERGSSRTLESVGAVAVLGAMIEQRRKSQPFLDAFVDGSEHGSEATSDDAAEEPSDGEHRVVTRSGVRTQQDKEVRRPSVGFLKVR